MGVICRWQRLFLCLAALFVALWTMEPRSVEAEEIGNGHSDLRQIWDRLEQLERQNEQLSKQNARLHRMIDPHAVNAFNAGSNNDAFLKFLRKA